MEKFNTTKKKDVIFMGQKKLGRNCLKYIHKMPDVNILGVCTWSKDAIIWWKKLFVREYAENNNIPIINPEDILMFDNVDYIISVLHPFLIKKKILNKAKIASINLHQGPLPEYRGCNSGSHAIMNGDKYFGATLHIITEEVDDGDIIDKRIFKIDDNITAKELYKLTNICCWEIFRSNIRNILDNNFKAYPQDKKMISRIYKRDSLQNKKVSLEWPLEKIWNFVRGNEFPPFEPAYIEYKDRKIYLKTKL
ncbi:MAG TPA: formyltransferase family protein [Candidatus Humimicrobiaceae bacterium]